MGNGMQVSGANLWNMTPQTLMFFGQTMPFMNSTFGEGFVTLDPGSFCNYWMKFGNMSMPMMGGGLSGFGGGWGNIRQWFAQPFQGIMGGGGWFSAPSTTTPSTSTTTATYSSPEEAKYKKLYTLVSKYADSDNVRYNDDTLKKKVAEINKSTDSYADKYTKLKAIYDSNKTDIDKYLLAATGDGIKVGNTKMGDMVIDTGYRTHEAYKTKAEGLVANAMDESSNIDAPILGLLSSYNSENRNLIEELCNIGMTNSNVKLKVQTLKNKLVDYAEDLKDKLDTDSATTLQTAIDELKTCDVTRGDFKTKFNKLYTYTRIIAAKIAGNMIHSDYAEIDDNILMSQTETDLKAEKGLTTNDISTAKNFKVKTDAMFGDKSFKSVNLSEKTAQEAMELLSMPEYGQLNKLPKVTISEKQYDVYQEAYGTDKLKYIVDDGKIYKLNGNTRGDEVTAQSIQKRMIDEHEKYVNEQKTADEKTTAERNERDKQAETERDTEINNQIASCKQKLKISINGQKRANLLLDESADILASAAHNGDLQVEEGSEGEWKYKKVTVGNDSIKIMTKGEKIEVYVYIGNSKNCAYYGYKAGTWTANTYGVQKDSNYGWDFVTDNLIIKKHKTFIDNIQGVLVKIFGDSISGWFKKTSS